MSVVLLEVEDVRAGHGAIEALHGVSLRVDAGEVVALIGANGAGKTTTLRAVCGLNRATEGSIRFDGEEIGGQAAHRIVRLGISLVAEGRRVFGRMSVAENLLTGAHVRRGRADVATDVDRVHALFPRLLERRSQAAGTLSGGEQQMLAIGRALMARPRLLLLDEPTAGLAPLVVERIDEAIAAIRDQGTAVLLAEQDAHHALQAASRAYVLEAGLVVLRGEAAAIRDDPAVRKAYLGV